MRDRKIFLGIMKRRHWLWAFAVVRQTLGPRGVLQTDSVQEVVVTGTGTQHLLKDAPVQTEVISHRQLQQYAGKSIEDISLGSD